MNYSVNLSTIFTEVPFLERFKKAREADFSYVECQFPYSFTIESIKKELETNQLSLVLLNLPPGNWDKGDRGMSIDPHKEDQFKYSVETGITYAVHLQTKSIHCMAGVLNDIDPHEARKQYIKNIRYAASQCKIHGLTLLIEPINQFDMPGYFLSSLPEAISIIDEVGLNNVRLQYDFYHVQRVQGNIISSFEKYLTYIGHVQLADVPGRHQPGTGEIHYGNVLKYIKELGYKGYIGLEYRPNGKSEESFEWLQK